MNEDTDGIIAVLKQVEQTPRHLTVIAERAQEGIVVIDLNGAIRFINEAWAAMHGYKTRDELIGKQISVFHTEEQMKTDVIPFIEEVKWRGQLAGPVDHVRRNGTPFPTEMLMVVFKDEAGKAMGLIGFATDLTEDEHTKDELKRYCNRLGELIKQQTDELKAVNARHQHEIAEHEQTEQRLKQQTAELSAANEQLQEQICEHERVKNELQQYCDQLEQSLREQSDESTTANEQLQHEITEYEQAEQHLKQQIAELTTANEQLQREIAERKQAEECLRQQIDELKAVNERLQEQINELSVRGPTGEADGGKAMGSLKTTGAFTNDDERALLLKVFRQNIELQKPELDDVE